MEETQNGVFTLLPAEQVLISAPIRTATVFRLQSLWDSALRPQATRIKLLDKLLRDAAKHEIPFKERAEQVYRIQALLTEINGVKQQIKRLQSQITILFADEDRVRACNLLKTKLENLFKELEELTK